MINLYDGQITDLVQNPLKYNPETIAIGYAIQQEKRRIIDRANGTRTLALIDELPEKILDVLAVELRTPFYQGDFSIESKRALIKDTLIFYTYMGTPEAVNRMLSAVFPGSYIEEWFYYGGEPYHFQVILETSGIRETAQISTIRRAIQKVKRLTAHMDGLIFQCNIGIVIGTHGQGYKYRSAWPGRTWNGTVPWRDMRGGLEHEELEIETDAAGHAYKVPMNGTQPWRDMRGGLEHSQVKAETHGHGWLYDSEFTGRPEAGTVPWRNTEAGHAHGEVEAGTDAGAFAYTSPAAGVEPYRSTRPACQDETLEAETKGRGYSYRSEAAGRIEAGTEPQHNTGAGIGDGGIEVHAETQDFHFFAPLAGTEPKRATTAALREHDLGIEAGGQGHPYHTTLAGQVEAGTHPDRETGGTAQDGAFFTTAEAEGFRYKTPICGTFYCKSKQGGGLIAYHRRNRGV
jgi:P2-related tail formation protein